MSNVLPVANAGPDQTKATGASFQLAGSGTDEDGTIVGYTWRQISGTTTALSSTSVSNPTGTAPGSAGTLVYGLTVTDNSGGVSPEDTVTINVTSNPLVVSAILSGIGSPPAADTNIERTLTVTFTGGNGKTITCGPVDWDDGLPASPAQTGTGPFVFKRTPTQSGPKSGHGDYSQVP